MSWDATLYDVRGYSEGQWNYTHNCERMLRVAAGIEGSWWEELDGLSGAEGARLLDTTIRGLEADPAKFIAMNPKNGWGSYDSVLVVLKEMLVAVPEWPCIWKLFG